MEEKKKVLIVGGGDCGLMGAKIAELKLQHPNTEVVTIEEAKERGLSHTIEITAPPLLTLSEFTPPKTRAERRKEKRKN